LVTPARDHRRVHAAPLLDATMRGLVIQALAEPGLAAHEGQASPFGAATSDAWSLAALGIAATATAFLEPDPATEWDDERLARVRRALSSLTVPEE
jgi:hypothetical protein